MSCFLIDKRTYVRAAGIVAGIAEQANYGTAEKFWLYDLKKGRNMLPEDYHEAFAQVYEYNRRSVSESWREEQVSDKNDYKDDFRKGLALGKRAYEKRWNGGYLRTVQELGNLFSSIRYQIDNPELERKAAHFLNAVMVRLYKQLDRDEHETWGGLEFETIEKILSA